MLYLSFGKYEGDKSGDSYKMSTECDSRKEVSWILNRKLFQY